MKNAVANDIPQRSLRDQLRTEAYLLRLDWHLEGVMLGAERRSTVRSLRDELASDPRSSAIALADLPTAAVLARRYASEGELRPLWSIGVLTAGITLLGYWMVFLSFTGGMLAAVDSTAPGEARATFLFVDVLAFSNADGIGIGWTSDWAWVIVPSAIIAGAFLLGSRAWRAIGRGRV